ncbi:MAG: Extra-cytoplasmic solute receptor [Rhizobium sp.]|nr:Extra-cytoplasmic solute receptor [Rhizobium sp.]
MNLSRRSMLSGLAGAAALGPGLSAGAQAQVAGYPAKDIRAMCGFPPGSNNDVIVRFFVNKLQAVTGRTVIVENRPGAFGNIATEATARSRPDGLTIYLSGSASLAAAPSVFKKLSFDPLADFTFVTTVANIGFVLLVDARKPIHSVADLTAYLRTKSGAIAYASATMPSNVASELYKKETGLRGDLVNYKTTADSMNDILGGQIDFTFASTSFGIEQQRAGRLRMLAVSSPRRMQSLPDVPSMAEAGVPGFDLQEFWLVSVAAKTPQPIVDKLEAWFTEIVAMEETKKFLFDMGLDPLSVPQAGTRAMIEKHTAAWREFVQLANIQPM